jgi:DNA-binding NarL/FixJ family response regulator
LVHDYLADSFSFITTLFDRRHRHGMSPDICPWGMPMSLLEAIHAVNKALVEEEPSPAELELARAALRTQLRLIEDLRTKAHHEQAKGPAAAAQGDGRPFAASHSSSSKREPPATPGRRGRRNTDRGERLKVLFDQGLSVEEMARELGWTEPTVRSRMSQYGLRLSDRERS